MKIQKNKYFSASFMIACLLAAVWLFPSAAMPWGRGHLYVIGAGPAGPRTATLQALDTLKQMEVIVAPQKQVDLFSEYVGQKPVLFDPWTNIWDYKGKSMWELDEAELAAFKKERFRIRSERVAKIEDASGQRKRRGAHGIRQPLSVRSQPLVYGAVRSSRRGDHTGHGMRCCGHGGPQKKHHPRLRYPFRPSDVSIFIDALGRERTGHPKGSGQVPFHHDFLYGPVETGSVVQGTQCQSFSGYAVRRGFSGPVIPRKSAFFGGTVADMSEKLSKDKEKFMGLLFVGRFLEGKPYDAAMKRSQQELGKKKQ